VAEAAACFANLAKGLRKEFAITARYMFPNLLDKLKDKNTAVCAQSAQALFDFNRHVVLPNLKLKLSEAQPTYR